MARLAGKDAGGIVETGPLLDLAGDWRRYLQEAQSYETEEFSKHERTGRPLGNDGFIEMAEKLLKRDLKKKRPGRKPIPKGED